MGYLQYTCTNYKWSLIPFEMYSALCSISPFVKCFSILWRPTFRMNRNASSVTLGICTITLTTQTVTTLRTWSRPLNPSARQGGGSRRMVMVVLREQLRCLGDGVHFLLISSHWLCGFAGVDHVSIQLDLETVFQFSHLVLTFKVGQQVCFWEGQTHCPMRCDINILVSTDRASDPLPCW